MDGGQDHHDGDVDGDDEGVLVVSLDVDRGLVDDVHHQRREECDGKDADQISAEENRNSN